MDGKYKKLFIQFAPVNWLCHIVNFKATVKYRMNGLTRSQNMFSSLYKNHATS